VKERFPAGAGEEGGEEEGRRAVVEDRGGTVAPEGRLPLAEDGVKSRADLLDAPGTGDVGLRCRARLVASA
jgi:hypothetical protein